MNCEVVRIKLSAFIDEALPEDEMKEVFGHLETCEFCDEIYEGLRATDKFYGATAEKEVPADYREALRERMLSLAETRNS